MGRKKFFAFYPQKAAVMATAVSEAIGGIGLVFFLCWTLMLAVSLLPRLAQSDECVPCEKYSKLAEYYSLADTVVAAGTLVLRRESGQFSADRKIADTLRRKILDDESIPPHCRKFVADKVRVGPRIAASVSVGLGDERPGVKFDGAYPGTLVGIFNRMVAIYNPCKYPDASPTDIAYVACLRQNAQTAYEKLNSRLMNSTMNSLQIELRSYGISATDTDIDLIKAFNTVINTGSREGLLSWSSTVGRKMPEKQFFTVVQMLGRAMLNGYNRNRDKNIDGAGKGIVSIDKALSSIKTNAIFMIDGLSSIGRPMGDFAVICRDAAVVQTNMLHAAGYKNSYAITYGSLAGMHTDIMTQNRNGELTLHGFNWHGRMDSNGLDGSRALFQGVGIKGFADTSISYVISNYKGRTVASVPSEMGKFLISASGGNLSEWDALSRQTSSISAVSFAPMPNGNVQLRAIYGNDGNGAGYIGGASSASWGEGTNFPGNVGIFGGQQQRPSDVYGTSVDTNAAVVAGTIEQHAVSPKVMIAPGLSIVGDFRLVGAGSAVMVNSSGSKPSFSGDNRFGFEVRADQTSSDGRYNGQYSLGANGMLALGDVRDANSHSQVPVSVYAGARASLRAWDWVLFAQTMAVIDQLGENGVGARGKFEAGFADRTIAASAFWAGRMTSGTSLLQDNSIRRVGVSVSARPAKHLELGLTGEIPVEGPDPLSHARVYGRGAVLF